MTNELNHMALMPKELFKRKLTYTFLYPKGKELQLNYPFTVPGYDCSIRGCKTKRNGSRIISHLCTHIETSYLWSSLEACPLQSTGMTFVMSGCTFWQDPEEIHIIAVASLFLKHLEPIQTSMFKYSCFQLQQPANKVKAIAHLTVVVP